MALASSWLRPIAELLTALCGAFLTYDFEKLRTLYPRWHGPIGAIEGNLPLTVIALAVLSAILVGLERIGRKSLSELQAQISEKEEKLSQVSNVITILCNGLLLNLASNLNLAQGAQVRLSLYVHDPERRAFIPCGRYSGNPAYARPGRTSYPDDQGCIGEGWSNGWHFDDAVPPGKQAERRPKYNEDKYNIPPEISRSIKMKSTLYAVKRLDDREGRGVAVLVAEAVGDNGLEEAFLKEKIEGSEHDYARVISSLRSYIPNPRAAADSGL